MPFRRRSAAAGLAVFVAALLAAAGAVGANNAPNPGFEVDCGGDLCNWEGSSATISRDTTNPHAGTASVHASVTGSRGGPQDCFGAGEGTYDVSFWYRTSDANALGVEAQLAFLPDVNCGVGDTGSATIAAAPIVTDGAWHQVTGTATAGASTHSARLKLATVCAVGPGDPCPAAVQINFDDVVVGTAAGPTAVAVSSFAARRAPRGVVVTWRTGAEAGVLGFDVRRGGTKLNRRPVAARGTAGGASYHFLDGTAPRGRGSLYRLEIVRLDGTRRVVASARVE
ncbi:MAG: hypothetical protein ABR521_04425 [Gaiellaceae bacterium]